MSATQFSSTTHIYSRSINGEACYRSEFYYPAAREILKALHSHPETRNDVSDLIKNAVANRFANRMIGTPGGNFREELKANQRICEDLLRHEHKVPAKEMVSSCERVAYALHDASMGIVNPSRLDLL